MFLELTGDEYTQAQQEAWIASFPDEDELGQRLSSQLTLVATLGATPKTARHELIALARADDAYALR